MVRLVRPANLIIVGITLILFWFHLILPSFLNNDVSPSMNSTLFSIFLLAILLIAAAGYVINDLYDVKADLINKPGKTYIGKTISAKTGTRLYLVLNTLALAATFFVGAKTNDFTVVGIIATGIILLWIYSRYLKSSLLVGNMLVSVLIGLVPVTLLFVEQHGFNELKINAPEEYLGTLTIILSFAWFAFLANLIREIIKDCEDFQGDLKSGVKTLTTTLGFKIPVTISLIVTTVLQISLILWFAIREMEGRWIETTAFLFLVFLPPFYLAFLLFKSYKNFRLFPSISEHLKLMMVSALIYLFVHLYFLHA